MSKRSFDDVRLRLAVQAALQPDALIENLSEGIGYYANFPFPLDAWYWVEEPRQVYDPNLARQLLAEAGNPDGIDVVYTRINRTDDAQMAQIVQAMLAQVGIRIDIQALERTSWLDIW
ncbi:MAG: ABC transporter substrate-binding protein [Chloroflexi bacterium]|nr:ABC transporter substrate-binding protein [Chloroflexota bacterium]